MNAAERPVALLRDPFFGNIGNSTFYMYMCNCYFTQFFFRGGALRRWDFEADKNNHLGRRSHLHNIYISDNHIFVTPRDTWLPLVTYVEGILMLTQ